MQEVAQCHTPKSHMSNDTGLNDIFSPTEETSKYLYKVKRKKRGQILYGILSILSELKCDIYWNRCEDKLDPNTRFTDRENKMYRGAGWQFPPLPLPLAVGAFREFCKNFLWDTQPLHASL